MADSIQINTSQKTGITKWLSLVILLLAQFGTMADNSGLSVSTASLVGELNASVSDIAFANAMYPLIAGAFMIVGGMLGLLWGWRRLFQIGALFLIIAECIAAATNSIGIFIWVARTLSGFGASFLIPAVLGLIVSIYKEKDRSMAFAAMAATIGIANTLAPIIFGYIIANFDYSIAFYVLSAFFVVIFGLSFFIEKTEEEAISTKFDITGTALVAIGLVFLITGLLKISEWGFISPLSDFNILGISPAVPAILLGSIFLYAFLKWEKTFEQKHDVCLMPQSFVQTPQLRDGLYMCGFMFFVLGGFVLIGVTYYELIAGFSAFATSGLISIFSLSMMISSILTATKLRKMSCRLSCRIGIILCSVSGLVAAAGTELTGVNLIFYVAPLLMGLGCGLIASQCSLIVTDAVNQRDAIQSGGVQATARNIGQTIGIAILGCVMLFSITGLIKNNAQADSTLSEQTQIELQAIPSIPFLSNSDFKELLEQNISTSKDHTSLMKINQKSRKTSSQLAWFVLSILCFVSVFTLTRHIPNHSLSQNKE